MLDQPPGRLSLDTETSAAISSSTNSVSTEINLTNDNGTTSGSLPPFVIRPTTSSSVSQSQESLSPNNATDAGNENNSFLDKFPVDQYYANHVIELSVDCLQCICEAS